MKHKLQKYWKNVLKKKPRLLLKNKKEGGTSAAAGGEVIITASSIFGVGTSLISTKLTSNPSLAPNAVTDLTCIPEQLLSG
eukprot:5935373-Ditylum_brightwellii.AAC.1